MRHARRCARRARRAHPSPVRARVGPPQWTMAPGASACDPHRGSFMRREAIDEAATLLIAAHRGPPLAGLPESCRPATLEEAHAIQEAVAAKLGERIAGWKVAATPEGRIIRGGILASRVVQSGARLAAGQTPLLGVECEIAFRFEQALGPRVAAYDYDEVANAVTAFMAIEVVDSRFST